MTELRILTANASGYVKIYADGNEITGKEGTDTGTGTALEFLNEEGYAVLLSTDGCEATDIYITGSRTGEVEAVEIGSQIPGQMSVQDVPGVVPEAGTTVVDGKVIDKATGEVVADSVPEHAGKVIDLRTAKQA